MGLFRKNWPHRRYLAGQARFPALREVGPKLWSHPQKRCEDKAPLPTPLESLPGAIQCAVKKGVQQALRDRSNTGWVGISSLPPTAAPPFKSVPLNETIALIVGGNNTLQQAGALELQDALVGASNQVAGAAFPIVIANPANLSSQGFPALFRNYVSSAYERVHVSGIQAAASSSDAYSNLLFSVQIDGLTVLDRVSLLALVEFMADAKPAGQIALLVANSDQNAVYLVYLTVKGWRYTVSGLGDYLSESLYRADPDSREAEDDCAVSDDDYIRSLAGSVNTGGCP